MNKNYGTMTDELLMNLYLQGDSLAFHELYHRYSGKMYAFIYSKISSKEDAVEIFQESLLRVHANRHKYDSKYALSSWIFIITRNILYDYLRKKKLTANSLSSADLTSASCDTNTLASELVFNDSLATLEQEILNMKFIEDLSYNEISTRLSITKENARKIVSRTLCSLRKILRP